MMITVKQSIELAGDNLLATLAPEHANLPYWKVDIGADLLAECAFVWPTHNIGRWWDALLRLEAATGFVIPAEIEAPMLAGLHRVLDNPLGVPCLISDVPSFQKKAREGMFDTHSLREIMLALAGLAKWRSNRWARGAASRMIAGLERLIRADCTWNVDAMTDGLLPNSEKVAVDGLESSDPVKLTYSHGRLIEALLDLYDATGQSEALRLASRLAQFHLRQGTLPDGGLPSAPWVHHHSLFGMYRGLLKYGVLTRQREYVTRVAACFRTTVRGRVNDSGFILECEGVKSFGETSSTGDSVQIALWLARLGYAEWLDDAERWVRACLLPSQFAEPMDFSGAVDDGRDEHKRLTERVLGAYGGVYREPFGGKRPTTDVTAATLHSLIDVYNHIVEREGHCTRINFHFDYEDDRISIRTTDTERRTLAIRTTGARDLYIRVPAWVDKDGFVITSGSRVLRNRRVGAFAHISGDEHSGVLSVDYPLPARESSEVCDGHPYTLRWKGDSVVSVHPRPERLPFYGND